jgi:hypothetical protein
VLFPGIATTRVDDSFICNVPWCGKFVRIELELVPESVAGNVVYPIDVVPPPEIADLLTLDKLPNLAIDW